MGTKKRTFTVVGFDTEQDNFDAPTGVMKNKSSYEEITAKDLTEAITVMLTHPTFISLSAAGMIGFEQRSLSNMTLSIKTPVRQGDFDAREINASNKDYFTKVIRSWAEKCRVKNNRGWRSYAIKDPIIIPSLVDGYYVYRTQLVLSNMFIYDDDDGFKLVDDDYVVAMNDLRLLRKELVKRINAVDMITFNHSLYGRGEVV